MVKLFGWKLNAQLALVMFLMGIGLMGYGIYVILLQYDSWIVTANWLNPYDVMFWIIHFGLIGGGAYMVIVGFLNRKGKR